MKKVNLLVGILGGAMALSMGLSAKNVKKVDGEGNLKPTAGELLSWWDHSGSLVDEGIQIKMSGKDTNDEAWKDTPYTFYKYYANENSKAWDYFDITNDNTVGVGFSLNMYDESNNLINGAGNGAGVFVHACAVDSNKDEKYLCSLKLYFNPDNTRAEVITTDGWSTIVGIDDCFWLDVGIAKLSKKIQVGFNLDYGFVFNFNVWDDTQWRPVEKTGDNDPAGSSKTGQYIANIISGLQPGVTLDHIMFKIEADGAWLHEQTMVLREIYPSINLPHEGPWPATKELTKIDVTPFQIGEEGCELTPDQEHTIPVSSIYDVTKYQISVNGADPVDGLSFTPTSDEQYNVVVSATINGATYYKTIVYNQHYLVKFGEEDLGTSYKAGATIVAPQEDPAEEGKTFDGWYNGEVKFVEGTTASADVTYLPKFLDQEVTVAFGEGEPVSYTYGEVMEVPESPTKDSDAGFNYAFAGWYDTDGVKLADDKKATKSTTYTAKFTKSAKSIEVGELRHLIENPCMGSVTKQEFEGISATLKGADERGSADAWTEEVFIPSRHLGDGESLTDLEKAQFNIDDGAVAEIGFSIGVRDSEGNIVCGSQNDDTRFNLSIHDADTDTELIRIGYFTGSGASHGVCVIDRVNGNGWTSYNAHWWVSGKGSLDSTYRIRFSQADLVEAMVNAWDSDFWATLDNNSTDGVKDHGAIYEVLHERVAQTHNIYFKISGENGFKTNQKVILREINGVSLAKEAVSLTIDGVESKQFKGEVPVIETPTKLGFTFAGWKTTGGADFDPTVALNEDVSIVSQWTQNEYSVKFGEADPTTYHYGDEIVAPEDPVKAKDAQYTYTFDGWYCNDEKFVEGTTCTGDAIYTAEFTKTVNKYNVAFGDAEVKMAYGATIVAPEGPAKAADAQYTYTFKAWVDQNGNEFEEGMTVTGDVTFTATYTQVAKKYTVSFDGVSSQLEYGSDIVAPADPTKEGYTFDGWYAGDVKLVAGTKVTGDVAYTSRWTKVDTPAPAPKGCGGSILAGSLIVTLTAGLGVALLAKKKEEK